MHGPIGTRPGGPWHLGPTSLDLAIFGGTGIKQFDKNQSVQRHLSLLMILRSKMLLTYAGISYLGLLVACRQVTGGQQLSSDDNHSVTM